MTGLQAVFFDLDGVIVDTERDGHRVAFNLTFREYGFSDEWDVDYYHELLRIGGGKERMRHHWETRGFSRPIAAEEIDSLIREMHKRKTAIFVDLIEKGKLPLRPGVHRFMQEVERRGLKLGVCTTSNEKAAEAIIDTLLADIRFEVVLAGDIVQHKKPDPEVYELALARMKLKPGEAFVIEDSRNGVVSATGAGLRVVATTNEYTENEDLSAADIIVTCLGDPDGEKGRLVKGNLPFDGVLHLSDVEGYFAPQ
jgi:HAD superfamily hydrolase (TIGR01509 family)